LITMKDIMECRSSYIHAKRKVPSKIIMNPVDAHKLYNAYREEHIKSMSTEEMKCHLELTLPFEVAEGMRLFGMDLRFAYHYPEDHFEITD
jgi:hypothetical protein